MLLGRVRLGYCIRSRLLLSDWNTWYTVLPILSNAFLGVIRYTLTVVFRTVDWNSLLVLVRVWCVRLVR